MAKINFFLPGKCFARTKDGGTRLTLKITPTLAETVPMWAKKIEPVVANITRILESKEIPKMTK